MVYPVEFTDRARNDLLALSDWVLRNAPLQGERWLARLITSIRSLETFPSGSPVKPELSSIDRPIRQMLFGRGRHRYRIYYEIRSNAVRVIHIRHGAREAPSRL